MILDNFNLHLDNKHLAEAINYITNNNLLNINVNLPAQIKKIAENAIIPQCIYEIKETKYPYLHETLNGCMYTVYVIYTLGDEICNEIDNLFEKQNYVQALMLDYMANSLMQIMDGQICAAIIEECKSKKIGLTKRLIPGQHIELPSQKIIADETNIYNKTNLTLTDSFMIRPLKSLTYIAGADSKLNKYNIYYDCRQCFSKSCHLRQCYN